jgi:tetratricopeptide (TPR) repeat protein
LRSRLWWTGVCLAILVGLAAGQTYEINGQSGTASPSNSNDKQDSAASSTNLGWGSSIEVARQARAAQDALKRGDYAAAADYAAQAAKSAPQNTSLWFLSGYAARLAGRFDASVEAYQRGLQNQPNSVNGLAGLAQTYARMGRDADARRLLQKVVEANPKDANSLGLAGELFLDSDPQRAVDLLRRADGLQPSAHFELLIARAYRRLNQPGQAEEFLQKAKSRAPHDPDVLRAIAAEYRESGKYDLAISTLQAIPAKSTDAQAELAYTYELAGKKQQAANLYAKLAKSAKGNIGLELSAAQALINLGQMDAARSFLQQAGENNASYYRLHAILAQIAESQDRTPDAIHEYEQAIQNLPRNVPEGPLYPIELRLDLYGLYVQSGNRAEAKHQLDLAGAQIQQAQVSGNSRPEYLRLRAAVESASGNLEAANKDLKKALALAPSNLNAILNYASLLWKLGQRNAARQMFLQAVKLDQHNRTALTSLGYLARDMKDDKDAEIYFSRAAAAHPKDFSPYLALGDLYGSEKKFHAAQVKYEAAYQRMPSNPLIVAGGANAALEEHDLDLAKKWLDRAQGTMNDNPQVMRERERYLTWTGEYGEAAGLGYKVIEKLPRDPEAPVYLAYDLYYLGRYDDALSLATKYDSMLPRNRDLALIAGYVHVRSHQYQEALGDFTRALDRDSKMAVGYANRGYVLNDLHQAAKAVNDFQTALQFQPDYPEAHLGLAYAYLQLHSPKPALEQLGMSEKAMGRERVWHLARGEAFRQEQRFSLAVTEYRAALQQNPNDLTTQRTLADMLYHMRRYEESIATLKVALNLSPGDPTIYALMAQNYARLSQREATLRYVSAAEQYGEGQVDIYMATGDALLVLGDRDAAMKRFSRALETAGGDRVGVRLAIAEIFLRERKWDDAQREIGLGFAEARIGDAPPVTADDFVEAANIFLAMHEFDLAETYFAKARQSGASERVVGIGLANTYLAQGNVQRAKVELSSLGDPKQYADDYDYIMARANLYRESMDTGRALSAFAHASTLAGENGQEADWNSQFQLAGEEGIQITPNFSLSSEASFAPALEDITVYTLDAKLLGVTDPALLPTPRHSFQSLAEEHYRVHAHGLPPIEGFVGEGMTTGRISFPSTSLIQDRHTYDTVFNGGIRPQLRLGSTTLNFNAGLQFDVRRDTISPLSMNQNLFRQFLYLSTTPFFNWVSVSGGAVRESGPFTQQDLHSRDVIGNIEFTVGRPWGSTSLLAGYTARDLLFRPAIREYYTTSTYVGLQHKFGKRLTAAALAEYLRSWRVEGSKWDIAQAMLPGGRFDFHPSPRWNVEGSFVLSRGEGFHAYDNANSQFLVSYTLPVRRRLETGSSESMVEYPLKFSFGLEQQTFYDFPGHGTTTLLPVVRFTLF